MRRATVVALAAMVLFVVTLSTSGAAASRVCYTHLPIKVGIFPVWYHTHHTYVQHEVACNADNATDWRYGCPPNKAGNNKFLWWPAIGYNCVDCEKFQTDDDDYYHTQDGAYDDDYYHTQDGAEGRGGGGGPPVELAPARRLSWFGYEGQGSMFPSGKRAQPDYQCLISTNEVSDYCGRGAVDYMVDAGWGATTWYDMWVRGYFPLWEGSGSQPISCPSAQSTNPFKPKLPSSCGPNAPKGNYYKGNICWTFTCQWGGCATLRAAECEDDAAHLQVQRSNAPPSWSCAAGRYGGGDGCDCNCGGWDPDCDDARQSAALGTRGCSGREVCLFPGDDCAPRPLVSSANKNFIVATGDDPFAASYDPHFVPYPDAGGTGAGATTPPPTWTCPSHYYASADGCDCDCGAHDPDCDGHGHGAGDTGSADLPLHCAPQDVMNALLVPTAELTRWTCERGRCVDGGVEPDHGRTPVGDVDSNNMAQASLRGKASP